MTAPINPQHNMTLTEVAYELGLSRQRVKQIETAALNKLRNNKKMRSYYEAIIDKQSRGDGGYSRPLDNTAVRYWR